MKISLIVFTLAEKSTIISRLRFTHIFKYENVNITKTRGRRGAGVQGCDGNTTVVGSIPTRGMIFFNFSALVDEAPPRRIPRLLTLVSLCLPYCMRIKRETY